MLVWMPKGTNTVGNKTQSVILQYVSNAIKENGNGIKENKLAILPQNNPVYLP